MAKGVPPGYTSFLQNFIKDLPSLVNQRCPELANKLKGAILLKSDYQVRLNHSYAANLGWSFRQNKLTGNRESKTLNIEFTPASQNSLTESVVRTAWRNSDLQGEIGVDESGFFFQREWGYGRQADRLTRDQSLINNLRTWAIDAMSVAISLLDASHCSSATSKTTASPVLTTSFEGECRAARTFPTEEILESLLVDHWSTLDFGADLEFIQRQKDCRIIGIIDILARDRQTGSYVVIELKKSGADDEVFGQLARYMGWVKHNLADPEGVGVLGIIIASRISAKLRAATASHPGVRILRYDVVELDSPEHDSKSGAHEADSVLKISIDGYCVCGTKNIAIAQYCRNCGVALRASGKQTSENATTRTRDRNPNRHLRATGAVIAVIILVISIGLFTCLR